MNLLKSRAARIAGASMLVGMAALAGPLASPALAASAPSCVDFWTTGSAIHTFHVYNGCSTTQRLKIIINFHTDSGCESVRSGYTWTYSVAGTATLDNVVTC